MRAAFAAWNRRDYEETLRYVRKDVVWRTGGLLPDVDSVYEGHAGLRRFWLDFDEPWETISISLEDVLDERIGQLLVVVRFQARGREAIEVDASFFQLYLFDDEGLVKECSTFVDEREARLTAGIGDA